MRWLALGPLALALAASTAGPARAEPIAHEGRLTLGPVWDSNPGRFQGEGAPSSPGLAAVLSLDASSRSEGNLTSLSLDSGVRGYTARNEDSELATLVSLGHASRLNDVVTPFVNGRVKDLRARSGDFDYTDASASAGLQFGPFGHFDPRLYVGAERFQYRPDVARYAFTAALVGASVRTNLGSGHVLSASWDSSWRSYQTEERTVQILELDWSYRGPVLLGAGYQIALAQNDPVLGTNRQRLQAQAGFSLPASLVLTLDGALYTRLSQPTVVTDNVSSLGAKLTLPLGDALVLEGMFRWYSSVGADSATYDRKLVGLAVALDF